MYLDKKRGENFAFSYPLSTHLKENENDGENNRFALGLQFCSRYYGIIWKYFRDQYIVVGHHLQLTSLEDFQTHFVSPIFASKPHLL